MNIERHRRLTERDILKISSLIHCLEDAVKELLRYRVYTDDDQPGLAEIVFYEEVSRSLRDYDDQYPF